MQRDYEIAGFRIDPVGSRHRDRDLQSVYSEIDKELRSQYVVGYYSRDFGGTEWRRVDVDVKRAGLKARTIAGYYR